MSGCLTISKLRWCMMSQLGEPTGEATPARPAALIYMWPTSTRQFGASNGLRGSERERYREAAILCILQSLSCLKTSAHTYSNSVSLKHWTQSHLLKKDKFWQREFIYSQDLFTGNNFGFSFSSSLSLSSFHLCLLLFLPPVVCVCVLFCRIRATRPGR